MLRFSFVVTKHFFYNLTENKHQVNKLFGFNRFGNHKNSYRFGWSGDHGDRYIRLYAYYYISGYRTIKEICKIEVHTNVKCMIKRSGLRYKFEVETENGERYIHYTDEVNHAHNFMLYSLPYFGGKEPATDNIDITLCLNNKP